MADLTRRTLLGAAAGIGIGLTLPGTATAAPGGFPNYRFLGVAVDKNALRYNPTGELIFPCIRGARGRVPNARAKYYLYYAPHDAPGGICLSYGDRLDRPFTEHPDNPIVARNWAPHYNVSHVSSPHVLWNEDAKEMWLYFHGENTTTRLARSKDGINFTYDKGVLSTAMLPSGTTEASYARVFRHDLPRPGARYVMVFMINDRSNRRSIGWGWSPDARNWKFAQSPLIRPQEVGAQNIGAPTVASRGGSTYVIYHRDKGSGGNMLITEVGNDFSKRNHLGIFHSPMSGAPDHGRCAAASFGNDGGVEYMFYEAGERLAGAIAVAKAV